MKKALQQPQPHNVTLDTFTQHCARGIAVFTRGLNLNLANINNGQLISGEWHANPTRIAVGDCFIVYHRLGPGPVYPATIYAGTIAAIIPLANGLHTYHAINVVAANIQGVSWTAFSGGQRSIRYFP